MGVAFITGGAGAIGRASARALVRDGWRVVLADIDGDELNRVAVDLGEQAVAGVFVLDVTDFDGVHSAVQQAAKVNGGLQGLVTAAGGGRYIAGASKVLFIDSAPESWDRMIEVHLNGVYYACHAILPVLYEGGGVIVNIASGAGLRGGANASHYSAAKAGIILFTQTMVLECAEYGVRINSIVPGNAEARWKATDDGTTSAPLGRPTSAGDIGKAVAWLISDDASHVTGACIDISGGTTLH